MPMRLTLRTLLAYLDEIPLPAEEVQSLKERIDESEFAQGLIQRIGSVLRRLRLGAPKVEGKGVGLDANSVAEYLDNTLAPERVADLERICLESDVHLAEVAACHQILALVVREPANVPSDLREHLYLLPDKLAQRESSAQAESVGSRTVPPAEAAGPATSDAVSVAAGADSAGAGSAGQGNGAAAPSVAPRRQVKPAVPDYLRAGGRRVWTPALMTLALVLLLVVAAIFALGRIDENHVLLGPIVRWLSPPARSAGNVTGSSASGASDLAALAPVGTSAEDAGLDSRGGAATRGSQDIKEGDAKPMQDQGSGQAAGAAGPGEPSRTDTAEPFPERDHPTEKASGATQPGEATAPVVGAESLAGGTTLPEVPAGVPGVGPAVQPADARMPDSVGQTHLAAGTPLPTGQGGASPTATAPSVNASPAASPPEGSSATEIGRYLPGERKHVLARYDTRQGLWYRIPERAVLRPGEQLLVLPSYRPQLAFTSGIQAMLIGPTYGELLPGNGDQPPGLAFATGAALLDTAGVGGSSITLRLAGHLGQLKFLTPDATLAVEVVRPLPLGQDPLVVGAVAVARLIATSGQLEWQEAGQPVLSLARGQQVRLAEGLQAELTDSSALPPWLEGAAMKELDLRASRELEPALSPERPLSVALREQASHRQVELAALAIQSLVALGEFEPALAALNQERFAPYWRTMVEALQRAVTADPRMAAELQNAWNKQRPDDAAILYRLLWGFNNEQLQAGDDLRLVQMLEHHALDVRVLAFDNLQRITGGKTYLYRPERDPAMQRRPLQEWRAAQSKGEIRWAR